MHDHAFVVEFKDVAIELAERQTCGLATVHPHTTHHPHTVDLDRGTVGLVDHRATGVGLVTGLDALAVLLDLDT